jgi:hypothetical protein
MNTIVYGFLGCGGIAVIAYTITQFLGKDYSLSDIGDRLKQILPQRKISEVNTKIVKNILPSIVKEEKIAEETKSKIIEIQKKAAVEITEILKQGDIEKIHKEIEKEWADI